MTLPILASVRGVLSWSLAARVCGDGVGVLADHDRLCFRARVLDYEGLARQPGLAASSALPAWQPSP